MTLKLISYERLIELAVEYGAKISTAERRLRRDSEDDWDIPVKKLNSKMKPLKKGEAIAYYKWTGTRVVLRD